MKRLTQCYLTDGGGETFMREVEVMSELKHENLARLLAYCKDGNERILVYEYMENRSLNLCIFGTCFRFIIIIITRRLLTSVQMR